MITPCSKCGSIHYATDRRIDGDTQCLTCGFKIPTAIWHKLVMSYATEASCDGCNGMCCRCFSLPKSPAELEEGAKARRHIAVNDYRFAVENFIFLGKASKNPFYKTTERGEVIRYYYSCRKLGWDGKCLDYHNRPELCRNFMVEHDGVYAECSLKSLWQEKQKCKKEHLDSELNELKQKVNSFSPYQRFEPSSSESERLSCSPQEAETTQSQVTDSVC